MVYMSDTYKMQYLSINDDMVHLKAFAKPYIFVLRNILIMS